MTTQIEVTFEAVDGGTLMTVVQSGFPAVEIRDFFTEHVVGRCVRPHRGVPGRRVRRLTLPSAGTDARLTA